MGQSVTNGACRRALRTRTRLDSLSGPLPTCHSAAAAKSSMWERAARQTSPSWRSLIHPSAALRSVSTSSGSAHISSPRRPSPAGRWTRRNVFLVLFVSRRAIFPLDPCRCPVPRASCPFDVILLFQSHYCWTHTRQQAQVHPQPALAALAIAGPAPRADQTLESLARYCWDGNAENSTEGWCN